VKNSLLFEERNLATTSEGCGNLRRLVWFIAIYVVYDLYSTENYHKASHTEKIPTILSLIHIYFNLSLL
jgi:hypothetical protein